MAGAITDKAPTNNRIITISELTKKFGSRIILSDVSLQINQGDSIAFIGRNGCGKSTLLKIIAGLLPFEKGKVIHNGRLKIGYVPERFPAINLTVREYITQIGLIAGIPKERLNERIAQLLEILYMRDMIETPIRYLSKGTIQKVAVVQAFLTTPDLLILDEPVSGQDTASQKAFIKMTRQLNHENGVTILCSCHEDYMIHALARSVYEIKDGKPRPLGQKPEADRDKLHRLLFARQSGCEVNAAYVLPEVVSKSGAKWDRLENREMVVYAAASVCDDVISAMLSDNFKLKGINDERIF